MAENSTLRIAWRNLGRNRRRSALAATAIGLGQFAFLATAAIMHGYADHYFASKRFALTPEFSRLPPGFMHRCWQRWTRRDLWG